MDEKIAAVLIRSLVGRAERNDATGRHHVGAVSPQELEALELAASHLEGTIRASSKEAATPSAVSPLPATAEAQPPKPRVRVAPAPKVVFEPSRLKPQDDSTILCLDFGTAKSKAFATRSSGSKAVELVDLGLGRLAGESGGVYPLTSAIWISDAGRLFVGRRAYEQSLDFQGRERTRLDSLKQQLSQGGESGLERRLKEGVENPTKVPLTYGDALTMFLAYLTDMAESELQRQGHNRFVRRRFALPAWDDDRLKTMEPKLRTYLAKAQLVADTLRGQWDEGIPVEHVRAVMDEVDEAREKWPLALMAESVLEPVAAGNSRLQSDDFARQLALVVDVGAGTTDFALFVVIEDPDQDLFKLVPVAGTVKALSRAGDMVDDLLRKMILEHAHVDTKEPSFDLLNAHLQLRIRQYKEDLFARGSVEYRLSDSRLGTITKEAFLLQEGIRKFEEQVEGTTREILDAAGDDKRRYYEAGLRVVLTGGGATLPMVQALGTAQSYHHGATLRRKETARVPELLRATPLAGAYPQLAVAMGGALPDLPVVGRPVGVVKGLANRTVQVRKTWAGS